MGAPPEAEFNPELRDALVQLSFAIHGVVGRASAEYNLSVTQIRLLGIVRDRTPPMTAIAQHLRLDRSSITGLVDRAEGRGLVARSSSPGDARVTVVRATPAGLETMAQVGAVIASEIRLLVDHLSGPDRDDLVRLAGSVVDAYHRDSALSHP